LSTLLEHDLVGLANAIATATSAPNTRRAFASIGWNGMVAPSMPWCESIQRPRWKRHAQADLARTRGDVLGPLHGVPLAHKDLFYRAGRVSTAARKFVPIMSPLKQRPCCRGSTVPAQSISARCTWPNLR
jgi:Asp-tRNA(Asn)/Glu-tRNA(Gln) amidotransferase A subunit family amidase